MAVLVLAAGGLTPALQVGDPRAGPAPCRTSPPRTWVPARWSPPPPARRSGSIGMFSIRPIACAADRMRMAAMSISTVPASSIRATRAPVSALIALSIRPAVVKSGVRRASRKVRRAPKSKSISRSIRAPPGIEPEVGTPWVTLAPSPWADTPPAMIVPCATA